MSNLRETVLHTKVFGSGKQNRNFSFSYHQLSELTSIKEVNLWQRAYRSGLNLDELGDFSLFVVQILLERGILELKTDGLKLQKVKKQEMSE